jgi:hypothetical protein
LKNNPVLLSDDPPAEDKAVGNIGLDFGSWYSSAGNIVGECGVPYEFNAEKQRSKLNKLKFHSPCFRRLILLS